MTILMPWLIDALLVFLLFYCTYRGYRSGFAKSVVSFVGYLLSIAVASVASKALAAVFQNACRSSVLTFITEKVQETAGIAQANTETVWMQLQEQLPGLLQNIVIHYMAGSEQLSGALDQTTAGMAEAITDSIIMPALMAVVQSILFFLIFGICCFIVRRLVYMCHFLRKVPLIGSVNAVLGGFLGCFQAILFILVLVGAVGILISVTGGIGFLDQKMISETHLFQYVYYLNPFAPKLS